MQESGLLILEQALIFRFERGFLMNVVTKTVCEKVGMEVERWVVMK